METNLGSVLPDAIWALARIVFLSAFVIFTFWWVAKRGELGTTRAMAGKVGVIVVAHPEMDSAKLLRIGNVVSDMVAMAGIGSSRLRLFSRGLLDETTEDNIGWKTRQLALSKMTEEQPFSVTCIATSAGWRLEMLDDRGDWIAMVLATNDPKTWSDRQKSRMMRELMSQISEPSVRESLSRVQMGV